MSYALLGFADIDPWTVMAAHVWSASDVYVLRLKTEGAVLTEPGDLLLFVRAAGQGQNLDLDVRGIAASRAGASIDIVLTADKWGLSVPFLADDAAAMAKHIAGDADLGARMPSLAISNAVFGRLAAPKDAIDHWLAQPILWDHRFTGPKGRGGPTDSFAAPPPLTLVQGKADDGKRAIPWPKRTGPGPTPKPASTTIWVGVAAVSLGLAVMAQSTKRRPRNH